MRNINKTKLKMLIEDRLSLQSTKRALESYRLPKISLNYFESPEFIQNHFSKWDKYKQDIFLKTLSGEYWKNYKKIIETIK